MFDHFHKNSLPNLEQIENNTKDFILFCLSQSPRPSPRTDQLRRTTSEPKYKHDYDYSTNESPKVSNFSSNYT